jgi:REP element-mobilizing transposase RayT
VYGEWVSLRDRYPQITLDAFGIMPNFVHGIIVLDSERQRTLMSEHPRSKNVRYSFPEIARGLQGATRRVRLAALQTRYSFARICDDSNLQKIRTLIWQNSTQEHWFSAGKDWLGLQEANLLGPHAKIDHRD